MTNGWGLVGSEVNFAPPWLSHEHQDDTPGHAPLSFLSTALKRAQSPEYFFRAGFLLWWSSGSVEKADSSPTENSQSIPCVVCTTGRYTNRITAARELERVCAAKDVDGAAQLSYFASDHVNSFLAM